MWISDHHKRFTRLDKIGCDERIHSRRYVKNSMCRIFVGSSRLFFQWIHKIHQSFIHPRDIQHWWVRYVWAEWALVSLTSTRNKSATDTYFYVLRMRSSDVANRLIHCKWRRKQKINIKMQIYADSFNQNNKSIVCYSNPFWCHRITASCVVIVASWRHSLILAIHCYLRSQRWRHRCLISNLNYVLRIKGNHLLQKATAQYIRIDRTYHVALVKLDNQLERDHVRHSTD